MKTAYHFILSILLLNLSLLSISCAHPTELTTSSPAKTYQVHFIEKEDDADYLTKFSVQKQDKILTADRIFHHDSGEFIGFGVKANWLAENVLSLGNFKPSPDDDEITVENQTDRVIRYLKISAVNKFLLLELQPHSKIKLSDYPQIKLSHLSWINVIGLFDDNQEIPASGMNFHIRGEYTPPAHYCVFVQDNEVIVQSKDFEGYSDKDVPEAKNPSCQ